ncbi:MAG TPA: PHB depolymerase family esterase [Ktedonosporobacter sp.]|nr:PHB depolymerase family esterase [Ktedonosporobacter sp.]
MSTMTFMDVQKAFWRLYGEEDYVRALEVVKGAQSQFPDDWLLYDWRLCMEARLNDTDGALRTLREVLDRGYWIDPVVLRDDEDLQSLRGLAEYEQLLSECQGRLDEARKTIKPAMVVLQPERKTEQPAPLVIALHGNTGNARTHSQEWQPLVARGWMVAAPHSTQLVAPGAAAWNDYAQGTQEVQAHYAALIEQYAIDPERVIVGGFSAGGGLAVQLAVSGAIKARGFVVVGPYLSDFEMLTPFLETARANGVRGYIVMGLQERPQGQELMRKIADLLNTHGIQCRVEERPDLGHVIPADFDVSLTKALEFIFADEKWQ